MILDYNVTTVEERPSSILLFDIKMLKIMKIKLGDLLDVSACLMFPYSFDCFRKRLTLVRGRER